MAFVKYRRKPFLCDVQYIACCPNLIKFSLFLIAT
ncbi:MAG: hypothetical protein ACI97N_002461, partial [Cognaticolwellia sp.]